MTTLKLNVRSWFSAATLALALLAPGLTSPASAQSDSDLRRQNQELTTRVKDLEAELEASRKQVETLKAQVAAIQAQLAAARTGGGGSAVTPLEEPKTTIDESKASASPRALINAITESYKKAVADAPMGQNGDRDRVAYMRLLDKWSAAAQREFRSAIEWTVRVEPVTDIAMPSKGIYSFIMVDPVTDARLGDVFNVPLTRNMQTHLAEIEQRGELGVLVMRGVVIPGIRINPDRESRGAFDSPRFIGPFVEYDFAVDASSITPYKPVPPSATAPATKPATPTAPVTPEK